MYIIPPVNNHIIHANEIHGATRRVDITQEGPPIATIREAFTAMQLEDSPFATIQEVLTLFGFVFRFFYWEQSCYKL